MAENNKILEVKNLNVTYRGGEVSKQVLFDVNFFVNRGETLGLIGESGAGKTTIATALMGMINYPNIAKGEIIFGDVNILKFSPKKMLEYRWKKISIIFQAAMDTLDPTISIGKQLIALLLDKKLCKTKEEAKRKSLELMEQLELSSNVAQMYPHQLSGGMKQRVVIAMAMSSNPEILIADEPTTSLDVVTQKMILDYIQKLVLDGTISSIIYISHDIVLVSEISDRIMVLYKGRVVEIGSKDKIMNKPLHPYTSVLVNSSKFVLSNIQSKENLELSEEIVSEEMHSCPFIVHCKFAFDKCKTNIQNLVEVEGNQMVACFLYGD